MSKYYYFDHDKNKVELDSIPNGAYVLAGYQDSNDKGKVTAVINGPALTPLYNSDSSHVMMPEYAGLTYDQKDNKWQKQ